jgi:hypothetical protein
MADHPGRAKPSTVLKFLQPTRNRIYEHFRNSTLALFPDYPDYVRSPKKDAQGFPTEGMLRFACMRLRR